MGKPSLNSWRVWRSVTAVGNPVADRTRIKVVFVGIHSSRNLALALRSSSTTVVDFDKFQIDVK